MTDSSAPRGLPRAPRIHIRDVDLARQVLTRVYGDLRLDVPGGPGFEWRADAVELGPVVIFSGSCTTDVRLHGVPSGYTISLAAGSRARASSSTGATEIAPGHRAAVFSPDSPCAWTAAGPFRTTTVRIDRRYLEAQLEALTGEAVRGPIELALPMATDAGAGAALERLCLFLVAEAQRADTPFAHPLVRANLGEAIARALLVGQPHDHTHLLRKRVPPASVASIGAAFRLDVARGAEPGEAPPRRRPRGGLSIEPPAATAPVEATVFVLDSDAASLEATVELLRGAGHAVRAFASAGELLASARSMRAGCVVFHTRPAEPSYRELRAALRGAGALPVVVTSDDGSAARAVEAMKDGAVDYLLAPLDGQALLAAVASALARDAEARSDRAAIDALIARVAPLSPREREVCEAVARGRLNKQIAADLGISEATVRLHRAAGMGKARVRSAAELATLLTRVGWFAAEGIACGRRQ